MLPLQFASKVQGSNFFVKFEQNEVTIQSNLSEPQHPIYNYHEVSLNIDNMEF